ncbi:hypothetical protein GQ44DRAFT_635170 [Phaeosphaeriaceae sp. PMI808]|nr:hypothetical protein GQ44DRAFT_635170 [Phaeosphaeriaceae sp. PMI808]
MQKRDPIQNSTLGFQQIFTLSLPSRTDRRDAITLMSSITGFETEFVDGVLGQYIDKRAYPYELDMPMTSLSEGALGCWRGHLNIIQRVVSERISTALITEDDIDWDTRLRSQLSQFAKGAKQLQNNTASIDVPYGNEWDLLWIGHDGDPFFDESQSFVTIKDDPTVPKLADMVVSRVPLLETSWLFPLQNFPEHTRFIHDSFAPIGTLAYAVSFRGAQKLLYHLSVNGLTGPIDYALVIACNKAFIRCISVTPTIISTHYSKGSFISTNS